MTTDPKLYQLNQADEPEQDWELDVKQNAAPVVVVADERKT